MKHTKEPWKQDNAEPRAIFSEQDGTMITMCDTPFRSPNQNETNAQRIVDCVNAMEAIHNPKEFRDTAFRYSSELGIQDAKIDQLRARVAALEEVIGIYADITEQLLPAVTEPEKSRIKEFNEKAKSILQ